MVKQQKIEEKKATHSFSRNLLLWGGAAATVGSYVAYRYFNPENTSEEIVPESGLVVLGQRDAMIASNYIVPPLAKAAVAITALAWAAFDQRARASWAITVMLEGFGMLPTADALNFVKVAKIFVPILNVIPDKKIEQNARHAKKHIDQEIRHAKKHIKQDFDHARNKVNQMADHMKAKLLQCYEHQKQYNSLSDWEKAIDKKIKKVLPQWARDILSQGKIGGNTDGDTMTVSLGFENGPQVTLYSSGESTVSVTRDSFIGAAVEAGRNGPPAAYYLQEAEKAEEEAKELVRDAMATSLQGAAESSAAIAVPKAKNMMMGVSNVVGFAERLNDPQYKEETRTDRVTCATAGTVTEGGSVVVFSAGAGLVTKNSAGVVAAAAFISVPADEAGDCVQEQCHKALNKMK